MALSRRKQESAKEPADTGRQQAEIATVSTVTSVREAKPERQSPNPAQPAPKNEQVPDVKQSTVAQTDPTPFWVSSFAEVDKLLPPSAPTPVNTFEESLRVLFSSCWAPQLVTDALEQIQKDPALRENHIRSTLAQSYESRKYGLRPPPRSQTKIGMAGNEEKEFAPEILELFQNTLEPSQVAGLIESKKFMNISEREIDIICAALRTGYRRDGLAWLKPNRAKT